MELTPKGRQLDDALAAELAARRPRRSSAAATRASTSASRTSSTDRVSIGPYVLSGGEIAAMATLDAVTRKLPGVISNPDSIVSESHAPELEGGAEYPHYTRPRGVPRLGGARGAAQRAPRRHRALASGAGEKAVRYLFVAGGRCAVLPCPARPARLAAAFLTKDEGP